MSESMTYRQLMQYILTLPPEVMEQPVTVSLWEWDKPADNMPVFPYLTDETDDYPMGQLVLPVQVPASK